MVTKIKIGKNIPLQFGANNNPNNYNFNYTSFINYPEPHVHITNSFDGIDGFLYNQTEVFKNIDKVKFDTYWFSYLQVDDIRTFTVNLPARQGTNVSGGKKGGSWWQPNSGANEILLFNHGRQDVPAFLATSTGGSVLSNSVVTYADSIRIITLTANSVGVFLKENYIALSTVIPAQTISGSVAVLNASLQGGPTGFYTASNYGMYVNSTRAIFGFGKFDSNYNYLYADPNGFKMYRGSGLYSRVAFRPKYYSDGVNINTSQSSWNNSIQVLENSVALFTADNVVSGLTPSWSELIPRNQVTGNTTSVNIP